MKIGLLRTNQTKENDGVWVTIVEGRDGEAPFRIKVRRLGCPAFQESQRQLMKDKAIGFRGNASETDALEITRQAVADTILVDWEGLQEDDGSPIPFSPAKSRELLLSVTDFYKLVFTEANNVSNFR